MEIGLKPFIGMRVWMSNINAHFHFHSANVYVSASSINAHVYCISAVCTLSFSVLYALRTLGHGKWWTKRMKGGERLFLSSLSLVLLGAIMVVMKAHLSPSQLNLIIHNGIAVALERGCVCVLFRGRSCMCVYENGCLKCSQWCIDLLMYLLGWVQWVRLGHIWYKRAMLCCVWSAFWGQAVVQNWINEHRLHSEVRLSKQPFELWSHLLTLELRGNEGKRRGQIWRQRNRGTCVER